MVRDRAGDAALAAKPMSSKPFGLKKEIVMIGLLEDKVLGGQVRPHVDHDMAVLKANSKGCSHFILVRLLKSH